MAPGLPGALVRNGAEEFLRTADGLFLDIDGVLLDVRRSYRTAIVETVHLELRRLGAWKGHGRPLRLEDIDLYKGAGGLNNDWDLAAVVVLWGFFMELAGRGRDPDGRSGHRWFAAAIEHHGGGIAGAHQALHAADPEAHASTLKNWDHGIIRRLFQVLYAGRRDCRRMYGFQPTYGSAEGLFGRERPLVTARELRDAGRTLGVITGRTRGEATVALGRLALRLPRAAVITDDDGLRKPDPKPLTLLARRLRVRRAIYVGDTRDDLEMVARALRRPQAGPTGRARFASVWITGGARNAKDVQEMIRRWRPGAVAPTLRAALALIR